MYININIITIISEFQLSQFPTNPKIIKCQKRSVLEKVSEISDISDFIKKIFEKSERFSKRFGLRN